MDNPTCLAGIKGKVLPGNTWKGETLLQFKCFEIGMIAGCIWLAECFVDGNLHDSKGVGISLCNLNTSPDI